MCIRSWSKLLEPWKISASVFYTFFNVSVRFLPPEWWYEYGRVYLEQKSSCSLSSFIWQSRRGWRQAVNVKHGVAVSEPAVRTSGSAVKVPRLVVLSRRMASSSLPSSAPGTHSLSSLFALPALTILHPSSHFLIAPNGQKTLQSCGLLFFPPRVSFRQHFGVTVRVVRRR